MKQQTSNSTPRKSIFKVLHLTGLILLLPACAAVNPLNTQPFQDYQSAISTLKDESDQALQTVYQTELDQFKTKVSGDDSCLVGQLLLSFPGESDDSAFAWNYSPAFGNCDAQAQPLFVSVADMRETLAAMNGQLLDYANLLIALAGADANTQFDPTAEANKFNQNASSLLTQLSGLGVKTTGVSADGLALFSTIGANLAKAYLEGKRVDLLTQLLNDGLKPLENFSELAQRAMEITALNAKSQYQTGPAVGLVRSIATNQGGSIDDLLSLNDQVIKQLALYQSIANGYSALPRSQTQLITALKQGQQVNLAELINYATNIKQQYQDLKNSAASGGQQGGE